MKSNEIYRYSADGYLMGSYKSISRAANQLKVSPSTISSSLDNPSKLVKRSFFTTRKYSKLTPVLRVDNVTKRNKVFMSLSKAAEETEIPVYEVHHRVSRKTRKPGRYSWHKIESLNETQKKSLVFNAK